MNGRALRSFLALLLLTLAGCCQQTPVGVRAAALGEGQNGFPNAWERAVFMAANRARSDPQQVKGAQSASYPAHAPLQLDYGLERSSRFHATMLNKGHAPLMHPSPCMLTADAASSGCDGDPACGCQGGTTCNSCGACTPGTDPFARIGMFGTGGAGEVAAAGYGDPWSVMDGWVDEPAGADGHRMIVNGDYGLVGFGHAQGAPNSCWGTFDVGDFGYGAGAPAKLAGAATRPYGGSAGTYRVYATWNDPAGGGPGNLWAVVDGACTPMTREMGDDHLNATWFADVPLGAGCHAIYVLAHDAGGARSTYPTTTAFVVSAGGDCPAEQAQPIAACDGVTPPDLGRPSSSGSQDGGSGSDGGTRGRDGGTRPGADGGSTVDAPMVAGGCAVTPGKTSLSTVLLFLLPLFLPVLSALARALRRREPKPAPALDTRPTAR